jgi:hypothetical protein
MSEMDEQFSAMPVVPGPTAWNESAYFDFAIAAPSVALALPFRRNVAVQRTDWHTPCSVDQNYPINFRPGNL